MTLADADEWVLADEADFSYTVTDGAVEITKYNGDGGNIELPVTIEGYPVTSIGEGAFASCKTLTGLAIPQGVTQIKSRAFTYCSALKTVRLPDSITEIRANAFYYGTPSALYITDLSAWCAIRFGDSNANPLYNRATLYVNGESVTELVIPDGVEAIGDYAFCGCAQLTSLTVPESVTVIGDNCFYGCSRLQAITLPKGLLKIGVGAFAETAYYKNPDNWNTRTAPYYSSNLYIGRHLICFGGRPTIESGTRCIADGAGAMTASYSLTIPNGVTAIGAGAFPMIINTTVSIPASVIRIGANPFRESALLTTFKVNENNPAYHADGNCLIETETKTLIAGCKNSVIPTDGSVAFIGEEAFAKMENLTEFTIPDGVLSIGQQAFAGCNNLKKIVLPTGLQSIEEYAFSDCSALKDVNFPDGLQIIGACAFYCTSLSEVTFPEGLQTIEAFAFSGCSSLSALRIPASVLTVGSAICPGSLLVFCEAPQKPDGWATDWYTGKDANVFWGYLEPSPEDDFTFIENYSRTGYFITGYRGTDKNVILPPVIRGRPVTGISAAAFKNRSAIESIALQGHLATIERDAFFGCTALREIILPDELREIDGSAFYGCSSLTSVCIPPLVRYLPSELFKDCTALTEVQLPDEPTYIGNSAFENCGLLAGIVIPESVTSIGKFAFAGCASLQNVTLPDGLQRLGDSAFSGCSALEQAIILPPDLTTVGEAVFADCAALFDVYCRVYSKPDGWADGWLGCEANVIWNYKHPVILTYMEGIVPTCTETGIRERFYCPDCDYYYTDKTGSVRISEIVIPALGHTPGEAATCTTQQICTVCNEVLVRALGHELMHHSAKQATCTEIGWNSYDTCTRCDYSTYREIPAPGHTPGKQATCTTSQICVVCNEVLVEALGHDLVGHAPKKPTCAEYGWEAYLTCTRCDYSTFRGLIILEHTPGEAATCTTPQVCVVCNKVLAQPTGHEMVCYYPQAATCTTPGWDYYEACYYCDYTTPHQEFPALGHTPGEWNVAKDQTCTEDGKQIRFCTVCNAVVEEEILPAFGHTPGAEATCTEAQTCEVCGTVLVEAKGHTPGEWTVTKEPTCTESGEEVRSCTVCGLTLEVAGLAELQHTPGAEATCTTAQTCEVCGTVLVEAKGHTPGEWTVTKEPTCTEDGKQIRFCTVCDAVVEEEILPAFGHTPGAEATCTTAQTCEVCGTVLVEAKGHTPGEWTVTKEPTCTEGGERMRSCEVCGTVVSVEGVAALGHTPGAEATCTEAQTCEVCGTVLAEATGHTPGAPATCMDAQFCETCGEMLAPMLDHTPGEWEVTVEPTATEDGERCIFCIACGSELEREVIPATGEPTPAYTPGDINGDGKVNSKDLTRLIKYLSGEAVDVVEAALDLNGDGKVNMKDYTRLIKYLSGEDVELH